MDTANLKPRELEIIVVVIKAMNADVSHPDSLLLPLC